MKSVFLRTFLPFFALFSVLSCPLAEAQTSQLKSFPLLNPGGSKQESAQDRKASESSPASFPGVAEVVSRAAGLAGNASDMREKISFMWDTSSLEMKILDAELRLKKLQDQLSEMGDPVNWDFGRLSDVRVLILNERKGFETLAVPVSSRLNELKSIQDQLEKQQIFWHDWKNFLQSAKVEVPSETFDQAQETIKGVLNNAFAATARLVSLQERVSRLIQESLKLGRPIEDGLGKQRSETLKKVEPSFFSRDFLAQFDMSSWPKILENLGGKLTEEDLMDLRLWWRVIGILLIAGLVVRLRKSGRAEEKWSFFLNHPFSMGIFVSEVLAGIFLQEPTGIWRYAAWSLVSLSASILMSDSLETRQGRFAVFFLTALVILSGVVKSIGFPTAVFRLYMVFMTLAGTVSFSIWARQVMSIDHRSRRILIAGLWAGAFLMAFATAAQAEGFVNLSDRLISSTIGTVFIILGSILLANISFLGVELFLAQPVVAKQKFVSRFGDELAARIKTVLRVAISYFAFATLLRVVGVFTSKEQVLRSFFEFHVTFGGADLSIGLMLLAILVLYFASSLSWFLRAILETEVFPRKEVDRGAGHAIKKLLHYSVLFIGFLVSISVLGLKLGSFVVLGSALGIGIGFGLQNIVNNFISGLILLFERPVKVGDIVVVDNDTGRVTQIGLRSTCIETAERSEVIVPNSQFISQKVTNLTLKDSVARLRIPVGVAYGSDMEQVVDLLKKAGEANIRIANKPEPLPLMLRFGESSLDFELSVWVANAAELPLARSEICREIARRFQEAGIEIPFPQRDINLRANSAELPDVAPASLRDPFYVPTSTHLKKP
jgi:potassium-dependent mechanosensitive channel